MDTDKQFSPAADRNKEPILEVLKQWIDRDKDLSLLEIGSGTGQHASYLASYFPNLIWQTSDLENRHPSIAAWLRDAKTSNTPSPVNIDLSNLEGLKAFSVKKFDYIYSANVIHIVSEELVNNLCQFASVSLQKGGHLLFYGPFKYKGQFTSPSNKDFDQSLRERDPRSGIRDIEVINERLGEHGFTLKDDISMPANNQFLRFKRL